MGHNHHHHHHHNETNDESGRNISVAFWLNTAFAIIELVGGILTNSMAILSDSMHDFGDSLALGLSYYFHKKSGKSRNAKFPYGYKRFSLVGAFINSTILIVGSSFIMVESIRRLRYTEPVNAKGMLVLAVLGLLVNLIAMLRLRKGKTVNERVVSLHFLEDVLGWVAVLLGSIVMLFVDVPVLDPILSLGIAAFILFNVYKNMRYAFGIILQQSPENINIESLKSEILKLDGVTGMHDARAWTMDGNYNVMTLHVVVKSSLGFEEIELLKNEVRHITEHQNINHVTIEMEKDDQDCALKDDK